MAIPVTPEQRTKILSAIQDEGMSVIDAAKTFLVTEALIKKWMKKQSNSGYTSTTPELQRMRQEIQELKAIIGEMVLHHKRKKGSFHC